MLALNQEHILRGPQVVEEFASHAEARLKQLGYGKVAVRVGDGTRGWVEHAPFDKILVTAAAEVPPRALLDQLAPGGRMIIPLGPEETQQLIVIDKAEDGRIRTRTVIPVRFSTLETIVRGAIRAALVSIYEPC